VSKSLAFLCPTPHSKGGVFRSFPTKTAFGDTQEVLLVAAKKGIAPLKAISNTDINDAILSELNSNQRNAVTSPTTGITRVVAGPGAGKDERKLSKLYSVILFC
jgi:hypothetical protein